MSADGADLDGWSAAGEGREPPIHNPEVQFIVGVESGGTADLHMEVDVEFDALGKVEFEKVEFERVEFEKVEIELFDDTDGLRRELLEIFRRSHNETLADAAVKSKSLHKGENWTSAPMP